MDRFAIIIPYFGKFNNYFQLWLASCGKNPNYDWLLFTDNRKPDILPENVHYIFTSFDDLKRKFESKFRYKICLDKPYKLCDYKPYYGYLFEDPLWNGAQQCHQAGRVRPLWRHKRLPQQCQ